MFINDGRKRNFIVKASHLSDYILHFNTLRPLPDLQQGFSPTTKKARKMQNRVRIELIMRLKSGLGAYLCAVQFVAVVWSNIFESASCCVFVSRINNM